MIGGLLAAAALSLAPVAGASENVERSLRILVGVPAGGLSDRFARELAVSLQQTLRRPVRVESRPGAGGRIAAEALKHAAADGSTVLLAPIIVPVIGPLVFRNLNYKPTTDFAPVSQLATYEFALAVAADHPARDPRALIAQAKGGSRPLAFGSPAAGSLAHFLGVALGLAAGIEVTHVPYQGAGALGNDLGGGTVPVGIAALSDLAPLHQAGRIRILASSGSDRSLLLPTVPTFRELGMPSLEMVGWHGVYAPAGTPRQVIEELSNALVVALGVPALRARLVAMGLAPTGTTPARLAEIMASDSERWAPVIKASGFSAD
jgi:tripartite-type tricarboxylate transporter receptor subunit TctC